MIAHESQIPTINQERAVDRLPRLKSLGLSEEQLTALTKQGFVAKENRGPHRSSYKLRFRLNGRQVVKCLGADAQLAEELKRELLRWQFPRCMDRELQMLAVQARRILRQVKQELQPEVAAAGFAFHGFAIRRPRNAQRRDAGERS